MAPTYRVRPAERDDTESLQRLSSRRETEGCTRDLLPESPPLTFELRTALT